MDLLGIPNDELLNRKLKDFIAPAQHELFQTLVDEAADNYVNPFQIDLTKADGGLLRCDGIAHVIDKNITILELEPLDLETPLPGSLENYFQLVQNSLQLSVGLTESSEIAELMAKKVKQFTGFDRVMIYRFAADYSGEVIGEAREAGMETFLHLHYPASDIPAQARALYLNNWVRLLHDVDAVDSPILPAQHPRLDSSTPLGKSVLRSMSPIHLQYLRNMGVRSTLTISLVVEGKLWGLIACHHRTPRFVPYGIRATSSLYGVVMSAQLARAENAQRDLEKISCEQAVSRLLSKLDPQEELAASFSKSLPILLDIFQADGAAFLSSGKPLSSCNCPSHKELTRIADELTEHDPDGILITDNTAQALPNLANLLPQAAGLIALPLGHETWLLILRNEYTNKVRWGGNPEPKKERDVLGQLTPRESFKEWTEEVKGHSKPWPEYTSLLVDELRSGLTGLVISKNRLLETANEELRHFASVIAHEVKSQIQPPLLALAILKEQEPNEKLSTMIDLGTNSLSTLSEFTSEMLAFAHMDVNVAESCEVDFSEVARLATEQAIAALSATQVKTVLHPLPTKQASQSQSHHLFLNLIRNSIIHGPAEGQEDFILEIGLCDTDRGECFFIKDNGRGIAEDEHESIFQHFYRGKNSSDRKGSGIGLGFVKRLLERTNDRIWVDSQLGKGSTFLFTLGN